MTSDLVTYLRALDTSICQRNEARAEVEQLRAEVEKLRAALMEISQYETNAPAGFEWDIVVEELVEIARKALEAKP